MAYSTITYKPLGGGIPRGFTQKPLTTEGAVARTMGSYEDMGWLERLFAPLRKKTLTWSAENPDFQRIMSPLGINEPKETVSSPYRWLRTISQPNIERGLKGLGASDQFAEDVSYGVRGAYNIPTFATSPTFAWKTLQGQRPTDRYEATTDRQKSSERWGQALYGQLLAAGIPLSAAPAGASALAKAGLWGTSILKRGAMGAALGAGFTLPGLAKETIETGALPDKQHIINALKQGVTTGVENSWMLAFTDLATDKVLGFASKALSKSHPTASKLLGGLVQSEASKAMLPLKEAAKGGAGFLTKSKLFGLGALKFLERALLEIPAEDAMWTAMNQLKGDEQRNWVQAFIEDLPETAYGNIMWAGIQTATGGPVAWKGTDWGEIVGSVKRAFGFEEPKKQGMGMELEEEEIEGLKVKKKGKQWWAEVEIDGKKQSFVGNTKKEAIALAEKTLGISKTGTRPGKAEEVMNTLKDDDVVNLVDNLETRVERDGADVIKELMDSYKINEAEAKKLADLLQSKRMEIDFKRTGEAKQKKLVPKEGTPTRPRGQEEVARRISEPGTKMLSDDFDQIYPTKHTKVFTNTPDLMEMRDIIDQKVEAQGMSDLEALKSEMPELTDAQAKNFLTEMDDRINKYNEWYADKEGIPREEIESYSQKARDAMRNMTDEQAITMAEEIERIVEQQGGDANEYLKRVYGFNDQELDDFQSLLLDRTGRIEAERDMPPEPKSEVKQATAIKNEEDLDKYFRQLTDREIEAIVGRIGDVAEEPNADNLIKEIYRELGIPEELDIAFGTRLSRAFEEIAFPDRFLKPTSKWDGKEPLADFVNKMSNEEVDRLVSYVSDKKDIDELIKIYQEDYNVPKEQVGEFSGLIKNKYDQYLTGVEDVGVRKAREILRGESVSTRVQNASLQDENVLRESPSGVIRSDLMDDALAGKKPMSGIHYSEDVETPDVPTGKDLAKFENYYKNQAKKKGLKYLTFDTIEMSGWGKLKNIFIYNEAQAKQILKDFGIPGSVEQFVRTSMGQTFPENSPQALAIMTLYGQKVAQPTIKLADTTYKLSKNELSKIVDDWRVAEGSKSKMGQFEADIAKKYGIQNIDDFIPMVLNRYNSMAINDLADYEPPEANVAKTEAQQKSYETKSVSQPELEQARLAAEALPDGHPVKEQLLQMMETAEGLYQQGTPVSPKYIESINTITNDLMRGNGLDGLEFSVALAKQYPELKEYFTKDEPITWDEVQKQIKSFTDTDLIEPKTRQQIVDLQKAMYALRIRSTAAIQALEQSGRLDSPQKLEEAYGFIKQSARDTALISNNARALAQQMQALRMKAEGGAVKTVLDAAIKEMNKAEVTAEEFKKAFKGVDMNNKKAVLTAAKEVVPPTLGEVFYEFRYANLLSSPKTQIVNFFTNGIQAFVTQPGRLLASGVVDPIYSALTGKERQHYMAEVPAYIKGLTNSIINGKAWKAFTDAYSGKDIIQRPDVAMKQTYGEKAELSGWKRIFEPANLFMAAINKHFGTGGKTFSIPGFMEGWDAYWQKAIKDGVSEAIIKQELIKNPQADVTKMQADLDDPNSRLYKKAVNEAKELIFRGELDITGKKRGQGKILQTIDAMTNQIYSLRNVKGLGWLFKGYIPFVKTPMEILKQGIEYSPIGWTTAIGAKDVADQVGKSLFGSLIFATAYGFALAGDTTWAAPKGEKERQRFYASGRKPYSIRMGDKWVSLSRLGPLAYPIAFATAVHWYSKNDPDRFDDNKVEDIAQVSWAMFQFFSDQSYMQGLSDVVNMLSGTEGAGSRALTNLPRQALPLTALQGWISRIIDPYYRNPKASGLTEKIWKNMMASTIYYSFAVDPYLDPLGNPSSRGDIKQRLADALLPWGSSPAAVGFFETYFELNNRKKEFQNVKDNIKEGSITPEEGAELILQLVDEINADEINLENMPQPLQEQTGGLVEQKTRELFGLEPQTGTPVPAIPPLPFLTKDWRSPLEILQQTPTTTPQPTPTPTSLPAPTPLPAPTATPGATQNYKTIQYKPLR